MHPARKKERLMPTNNTLLKAGTSMVQILRWFTLLIWLLWFLIYWHGGARALADIRKSVQESGHLDTALMLTIALGSLALAASGLEIASGWVQVSQSLWLAGIGALLTLLGVAGTFYCRHALGAMWTAETTLQSNHQIVDSGPYGIVRHPIYSTVIVMYVGIALTFASWSATIAVTVIVLAYVLKARLEDNFLAEQLPGYREYKTKVRFRLIPGIW